MRDINRIPIILKELEKIWKKYPDLRLGQLLANVYSLHNGFPETNIYAKFYYSEDEDLIKEIKEFYDN